MSKQLSLSATMSAVAMAALAFGILLAAPTGGSSADRAATAHGSLVRVMLAA